MKQNRFTTASNSDLIRWLFWDAIEDGKQGFATKVRDKEERACVIELMRRLGETVTPDQLTEILE